MRFPDGRVRKLRKSESQPGCAHELTFSCFKRRPFLISDRTRQWFVEALASARARHNLELWAYVIMPEHAHVLLMPRKDDYSIAGILKSIKQSVARRAVLYLRRERPDRLCDLEVTWPSGRVEHRFWQQGGGYDRNIVKLNTVAASVEYIHRNPVRRGLVGNEQDWDWSSARFYAGADDVALGMDPYLV